MRILVNDHAGHPFQVELSRSLAERGNSVLHTFTAGLQTPRGAYAMISAMGLLEIKTN